MARSNSSNKLLITIIILLILIILSGAGGLVYYFTKETKEVTPVNTQVQTSVTKLGPIYPLAPITVNLKNRAGKDIYLKITLSFELNDKLLANELDAKNAVIRDNIILLLSSKTLEDISSDMGKEDICNEIKNKINPMLSDGKIKNVYILNFLVE